MKQMIKKWLLKFSRHLEYEEQEEGCKNAQRVASKHGYTITCPEDEIDIKVTMTDENCEKAKKVASKYGFVIVCDEE